MAQYLRPASDISNNTWTKSAGTTLYGCIDEASYDDADYIRATGATNQTCEVKLSSGIDPLSSSGHIVRFRAKATGSSGGEKMTVTLYQGTTLIATILSAGTITRTTFNEYSLTLSSAQADAITDYTDLRIRFATTSIGAGETIDVSWAEMETPPVTHEGTAAISVSANLTVIGTVPPQTMEGTAAISVSANLIAIGLRNATYFTVDNTTNYYGTIISTSTVSQDDARAGASESLYTVNYYVGRKVINNTGTGYWYVYRTFIRFNTASLAGKTILSARLRMQPNNVSDSYRHFDAEVLKLNWTGPLNTNLDLNFDAALTATVDSIWANSENLVTNFYSTGVLSDLTWINDSGYTYYALRSKADYDNLSLPMPAVNGQTNWEQFSTYTQSGPTRQPYLIVEWASNIVTHEGTASIAVSSNLTANASVGHQILEGTASIQVSANLTAIGLSQTIHEGIASIAVTSNLIAIGQVTHAIHEGTASIQVTANLTAIGSTSHQTLEGTASIAVTSQLTIAGNVNHPMHEGTTAINVGSTLTAIGSVLHQILEGTASLLVTSELTVKGSIGTTHEGTASINVASTLLVAGSVTHVILEGTSTIGVTSILSVIGSVQHQTLEGTANIAVASNLSLVGSVTHAILEGTTSITVISTLTANAYIQGGAITHEGKADITVTTILTANGLVNHQILEGQVNISVVSGLTINASTVHATLEGIVTIAVVSNMNVAGIVLHVIHEGTANLQVISQLVVNGQVLTYALPPACRIFVVPAENRIYVVEAESRVLRIPREYRTVKITCNGSIIRTEQNLYGEATILCAAEMKVVGSVH